MSKKIFYNKLVRDKIPEIIISEGKQVKTRILSSEEYELELKKKLLEEANEVIKSNRDHIADELLDILEIVRAICMNIGMTMPKLDEFRKEKKRIKGGFTKKVFLKSVE